MKKVTARLERSDLLNIARIIVGCLLPFLVLNCVSSKTGRITVLPTDRAGYVYVLPDGQRILFRAGVAGEKPPLTLLDAASGQETPVSPEIDEVGLLGNGLLWGRSYGNQDYYVINLTLMSVIRLKRLQSDSTDFSEYVRAAEIVYVIRGYAILLLEHDLSGSVTGGYYIKDVRDPAELLAGVPYEFPQGHPYYSWQMYNTARPPAGGKFPSADGRYYYTYGGNGVSRKLQIYSQEDELVSSVTASGSAELFCHGWAWDSSGVYFQEMFIPGITVIGPQPWHGPLELLKVEP